MGLGNSGPPTVLGQLLAEVGWALFGDILGAIMAKIDELRTQVTALKADTDQMQGRVLAGVTDLKAQIQALKDQLANVEVPQEITDMLSAVDATVNALDPTKPDVLKASFARGVGAPAPDIKPVDPDEEMKVGAPAPDIKPVEKRGVGAPAPDLRPVEDPRPS